VPDGCDKPPEPAPKLQGDAQAAVKHRGSNIQIIAAAGSGKTEVVSQRVADLLETGVPASATPEFRPNPPYGCLTRVIMPISSPRGTPCSVLRDEMHRP